MHIIGILGPIHHGKSTLARFLSAQVEHYRHLESSDLIADTVNQWKAAFPRGEFANRHEQANAWIGQLPAVLRDKLRVDLPAASLLITDAAVAADPDAYEKLWLYLDLLNDAPALIDEPITGENKELHRPILQWIGGYVTAHAPTAWFDELVRQAQADNEIELVTIGGVRFPSDASVIKAAGGILAMIVRPDHEERDVRDPTERERGAIKPDATVHNDGTLEQLEVATAQLWRDLQTGQLKPSYSSSDHTAGR